MTPATGAGRGVLATVLVAQALRDQGLDAPAVGLVLAAIVAGSAVASLALGRWGDRVGRARSYGLLYGALTATGILIAAGAPPWLLALVALSGALSTEVVESGPFTTLEQVILASTGTRQPQLVRGFGLYNATATLAGAAGALLGTLPAD
jgi:MFS family permease